MPKAIIMTYINITSFLLIHQLEKDPIMIEMPCLKKIVIFFQTILTFVLLRKSIYIYIYIYILSPLLSSNSSLSTLVCPLRSSINLSCADELSKSQTVVVGRLISYIYIYIYVCMYISKLSH